MPVSKRYISKNTVCKASFYLPREINAKTAYLVGDFNNWNGKSIPMTQLKSGQWKAEIKLDAGHEYQYRFLVNGSDWHNDWDADRYAPNPHGEENSVVVT